MDGPNTRDDFSGPGSSSQDDAVESHLHRNHSAQKIIEASSMKGNIALGEKWRYNAHEPQFLYSRCR
jgi:hypothetical protein